MSHFKRLRSLAVISGSAADRLLREVSPFLMPQEYRMVVNGEPDTGRLRVVVAYSGPLPKKTALNRFYFHVAHSQSLSPLDVTRILGPGIPPPPSASSFLSWVEILLPPRLRREDVGDALELIARRRLHGVKLYTKLLTTAFWLLTNALREVSSSLLGKKRSD
jgi:hypothetical protein